jgi:RNA-binding protein YlmH
MDEKDLLLRHMEDLAERALKTGHAASRFLTPAEAQNIAAHFSLRREITFLLDGGYEEAERVRAIFLNPNWGEYDRTDLFHALKIEIRSQDTLGHRDILGAVMALGIERNTIGDIIETPSLLICLPEISGYIMDTLKKAGHVGLKLYNIPLHDIPAKKEDLTLISNSVVSLRLDVILCAAYGLSRNKALNLIQSERVSLNHEVCKQPAKELYEGVLLSVRGLGRAKLLEIGGTSKKGRIFVRIGLYKH